MFRRILDGLTVLWGITACLLVAGGRDLLAAPGACDKECREVDTYGKTDFTSTKCWHFKFKDCNTCVVNGCDNNVAKLNGTCQDDNTTPWEYDDTLTPCSIKCNTITPTTRVHSISYYLPATYAEIVVMPVSLQVLSG